MRARELAETLRQSVQGCVIHAHGPVQAWARIMEAQQRGSASAAEVLAHISAASEAHLKELRRQGAEASDPRIHKEELTLKFVEKLLR